ncbi:hypothetical protein RQP46_010259 [Phenoliferia psychrophenolica]
MSVLIPDGNAITNATMAGQQLADALMGPPFMGWMLNVGVFGLVIGRFFDYTYSQLYAEDPWHTKAVLWTVMALCTTSVGVSVGQLLRDRRVVRLFLLVGVGSMAVVAFGFSIAVSVLYATGSANTKSVEFTQEIFDQFHTVDMCDVDIAISAALYLVVRRLIAGFNPSTDSAIVRLIKLSVETASYTSLVAIGGALMSDTLSLLVTLNGRSKNADGSISWKHSADAPTARHLTTHAHTHTATNRAEICPWFALSSLSTAKLISLALS